MKKVFSTLLIILKVLLFYTTIFLGMLTIASIDTIGTEIYTIQVIITFVFVGFCVFLLSVEDVKYLSFYSYIEKKEKELLEKEYSQSLDSKSYTISEELLDNILMYCENESIYDNLESYGNFYYVLRKIKEIGKS